VQQWKNLENLSIFQSESLYLQEFFGWCSLGLLVNTLLSTESSACWFWSPGNSRDDEGRSNLSWRRRTGTAADHKKKHFCINACTHVCRVHYPNLYPTIDIRVHWIDWQLVINIHDVGVYDYHSIAARKGSFASRDVARNLFFLVYKFFGGGINLQCACSIAVLTSFHPIKSLLGLIWGVYIPIYPRRYAPVL